MTKLREVSNRPADEVDTDAPGADVAKPWELTDEEREAFENRPRLRGPIWIVLPLFAIAVVTLPIWGALALANREVTAIVLAVGLALWRIQRHLSRR